MVGHNTHDCRNTFEERTATLESPYHFTESGLPNVYLCGIKYRVCQICRMQSADIPALKNLMMVIARSIVESEAQLTGSEIRFLRKRLGLRSSELAALAGVSVEQVSRWENGRNKPEKSADKLIRMAYCHLSGDRNLHDKFEKHIAAWLPAWTQEGQSSEIRAKLRNKKWEAKFVIPVRADPAAYGNSGKLYGSPGYPSRARRP